MLIYHQRTKIRQKIHQTFKFILIDVHRYYQHKWNLFGI